MRRGASSADIFDQVVWESDTTALLGEIEFHTNLDPQDADRAVEAEERSFNFVKDRPLLDAYRDYWTAQCDPLIPRNIFEVGLWDGGSAVFWFELMDPAMHVGVDITDRRSEAFKRYEEAGPRKERLATYWDVDQADKGRLRKIAQGHFDAPLDLVIDDASHLYAPTKATLEALLPLVRPGGWYLIEDWAWGHWGPAYALDPDPDATSPTRLIAELLTAVGSLQQIIAAVDVRRGFTVIHRGEGTVDPREFSLDELSSWSGAGPMFPGSRTRPTTRDRPARRLSRLSERLGRISRSR